MNYEIHNNATITTCATLAEALSAVRAFEESDASTGSIEVRDARGNEILSLAFGGLEVGVHLLGRIALLRAVAKMAGDDATVRDCDWHEMENAEDRSSALDRVLAALDDAAAQE